MIIIVPKWLEDKISWETIAYCWLYVIVQPDGRWFVYKDRFGPQEFISPEEGLELIKTYQKHELYNTLISY